MSKATLVFLITDTHILLAPKLKKVGAGKLNGYGGRVQQGESVLQAAVRELREESTVEAQAQDLHYVAHITAHETDKETWEIDVFLLRQWQGVAKATAEMGEPAWYPLKGIHRLNLNVADEEWMNTMIRGKRQTVVIDRRVTQARTEVSIRCTIVDELKVPA